eukprot:CAMPEP_0197021596 /NCGR_PEP_ID=MMETSP1384-20130603/2511_1 /TAXON_ID=29189 /ORGANISM="Ammonia sp." /LENGTH=746 /DNA_ID=CAMNT_0042449465 /DNA_START=209 /DNA_END=2449 /DNA_ORIENTATION=-
MAHPGNNYNFSNPINNNNNNNSHSHSDDVFDTKNFDKIDYIVQLPLIENPQERQTRFLLAMDYTLPSRDGLGVMDTALEHIVHYYDMKKVELIFCEMFQSVCLFIEFADTATCSHAYNQLFQFFKNIFYVEDLSNLEELWICAHCKHYNQFTDNLRGLHSINDLASKRKDDKGDDYVYWCTRCKNVNSPSFKKIKYSYQKLAAFPAQYHKSNRVQIGAISKPTSSHTHSHHAHEASHGKQHWRKKRKSNQRASAQPAHYALADGPNWQNAKSQPIASTSSIYAQMQHNQNQQALHHSQSQKHLPSHHHHHHHQHNGPPPPPPPQQADEEDESFILPAGNYGAIKQYQATPGEGGVAGVEVKEAEDDEHEQDEDVSPRAPLSTPAGHVMLGQASGCLKFNLPAHPHSNPHQAHHHKKKSAINGLIASKSLNDVKKHSKQQQHHQHHRHGSGGSAMTGISSSPELVSPQSSAPKEMPFELNARGKKYSVDSQVSITSTTSTVSSIDNNLELCCQILENIEQETNSLNRTHQLNMYDAAATHDNLQQLEQKKQQVMLKIATMSSMLKKIEHTFMSMNVNINGNGNAHSAAMNVNVNVAEYKQAENDDIAQTQKLPQQCAVAAVYKHDEKKQAEDEALDATQSAVASASAAKSGNVLTSHNLLQYNQQHTVLSDASDKYTHSSPQYDEEMSSNDEEDVDDLRTPAGNMLLGQADGLVAFRNANQHHDNAQRRQLNAHSKLHPHSNAANND